MSYEADPAWHLIRVTEEEDAAFQELEARRDRESDYAPARALGGAASPCRRAALLAAKAADPSGEQKSAGADVASAEGCLAPRPFSSSSPSAAGLLLAPPSPRQERPAATSPESEAA